MTEYIVLAHNNDIDGPAHWVVYRTRDAATRAAKALSADWLYVAVRETGPVTYSESKNGGQA